MPDPRSLTAAIRRGLRPRGAGFTLVELVIVIVIIGVLSAVAVPRFGDASVNARLAQVRGSTLRMQTGLDIFMAEHPGYTPPTAKGADNDTRLAAVLSPGPDNVLTQATDASGDPGGTPVVFGPYVKDIAANALIDGDAARDFVGAADPAAATHPGGKAVGWFCCWDNGRPIIGFFTASGVSGGDVDTGVSVKGLAAQGRSLSN